MRMQLFISEFRPLASARQGAELELRLLGTLEGFSGGPRDYLDLPQEHTMLVADWWKQPYSDLFTLQHTVLHGLRPTTHPV